MTNGSGILWLWYIYISFTTLTKVKQIKNTKARTLGVSDPSYIVVLFRRQTSDQFSSTWSTIQANEISLLPTKFFFHLRIYLNWPQIALHLSEMFGNIMNVIGQRGGMTVSIDCIACLHKRSEHLAGSQRSQYRQLSNIIYKDPY